MGDLKTRTTSKLAGRLASGPGPLDPQPAAAQVGVGLLSNTPDNFVGGQTAYFHEQWSNLTSDPWVLNQIRGITIPFETLPVQISVPLPYRMNEVETAGLDGLLGQLLSKGLVGRSPHEEGEWISNVFLRPKPGGEHRMILDLTELNKFIVYEQHFKMFSLQTAVELVEEGCWMASVDLKDAYTILSRLADLIESI